MQTSWSDKLIICYTFSHNYAWWYVILITDNSWDLPWNLIYQLEVSESLQYNNEIMY